MAVFAIGVGSDTSAKEVRVALEYVERERSAHDLIVTYDADEVNEIEQGASAESITDRLMIGDESPNVLLDWTRDHCDLAEKVVMVTSAPFIPVYPDKFEQRLWSGDPTLEPYCASMLVLIPRKGRVIWTEDEVQRLFLGNGKLSKVFQRILVLDHDSKVSLAFENPNECISYESCYGWENVGMNDDGSFNLPSRDDPQPVTRSQIPLEKAR